MTKKFLVSLLFIALFVSVSSAAGRYMASTGTNVRVRATPSTKANILFTIDKGRYVHVVGQKNIGEKFPWYNIEDEDGDGWVYGQFLRELEIKQKIDFNPDSVDGTPFGTPYSEINDLSELESDSLKDYSPGFFRDSEKSNGDWKYSAVNNRASTKDFSVSYLFDAEQRLIGMYIRAPWEENSKIEKMYEQLESRFGETQSMWVSHNGEIRGYNVNGFNVFFGVVFNTGDGSGYSFIHSFVNKKI